MDRFAADLAAGLGLTPTFVGYASPDDLDNLPTLDPSANHVAGIAFYTDDSGARGAAGIDPLSHRTHYVLRMPDDLSSNTDGWSTDRLFRPFLQLGPDFSPFYAAD